MGSARAQICDVGMISEFVLTHAATIHTAAAFFSRRVFLKQHRNWIGLEFRAVHIPRGTISHCPGSTSFKSYNAREQRQANHDRFKNGTKASCRLSLKWLVQSVWFSVVDKCQDESVCFVCCLLASKALVMKDVSAVCP